MGISYANDTITVTGGSRDDPYTMADLDADGTVGQYITPGGYGNHEYGVSKDLVIGSEDADTFFDLSGSIIKMDAGRYLTVYTTALRGGRMGATFGATESKSGATPFLDEQLTKQRVERVRKLYCERSYQLDNTTGDWIAEGAAPRIIAVAEDDVIAEGPYAV
ncbi:MAG: hypothetical protein JW759_03930 [Candidatus Coatesbacteria bacterium]|nr:hypothetical protein [Candidatus Coatesbacteria bacterium]